MKNYFLLLFTGLLALTACRKSEIVDEGPVSMPELSLAEAKAWFKADSLTINSSAAGFHLSSLQPDWKGATAFESKRNHYWLTSVPGRPVFRGVQGYRKLIFFRDQSGMVRARILEIVPDAVYWQRKGRVNNSDFTGRLFIYDENYRLLSGVIYADGKQIGESKLSVAPADTSKLRTQQLDVIADCNWYDSSYIDAEGVFTIHSDKICTYTVVDNPYDSDGGPVMIQVPVETGYGGGGSSPTAPPPPPEISNLPGEDQSRIDPKKYVRCFGNLPDAGAAMSVTLFVQQPLPGTSFNIGSNSVGHVAVGLTKTSGGSSVTQTMGYYPDATGKAKLHAPSKVVDNGGLMDYNVSITYQVSASQFQAILDYVSSPPPTYDLIENNCASFAVHALTNGGLIPPNAYSAVGLNGAGGVQTAMTPAGLGSSISNMAGQSGVNTKGGTTPNSKGPCN